MEAAITPVLLCGGSGTRLWPRSRPGAPKPFLPLIGDATLFEQALERCRGRPFGPAVVVTGAAQELLVEDQLGRSEAAEIIVEPQPKQTAAAVALAAHRLPAETIMLVCPSDHHISDPVAFRRAAAEAAAVADEGWLVCVGIRPTAAETRFGYIRRGEPVEDHPNAFQAAEFVEKPAEVSARKFLEDGNYVWNGGIFAFRAKDYLEELQRYRPQIAARVEEAIAAGQSSAGHFRPDPEPFARIEAESLDYAVMEQSKRVAVVMADMGWSDVGDWQALYARREKDDAGNAVRGPAELVDCRRVLVDSDGPTVHVIGLTDLVVVVDGDDILVASSSGAGQVGKLGQSRR